MTILLTVSPKEAVQLLNGTLSVLVRSWKVPCPCTAYIGVSKARPYLLRLFGRNNLSAHISKELEFCKLNGLIVTKCEITDNPIQGVKDIGNATYIRVYGIRLSSLSVLDKPMEVKQFYTRKCKAFKATGTDLKHSKKIEYTRTPLSRLPSRWQYVEVGE